MEFTGSKDSRELNPKSTLLLDFEVLLDEESFKIEFIAEMVLPIEFQDYAYLVVLGLVLVLLIITVSTTVARCNRVVS